MGAPAADGSSPGGMWWDMVPKDNVTPPTLVPGGAATAPAPAATDDNWWSAVPKDNVTPPAPDDRLLPNADYGFTSMGVHGLTAGASDPIRAAMHAVTDWGATQLGLNEPGTQTPTDRGFDFMRRWDEIARGRRQYESEYPELSTVANIAGGLASGGAIAEAAKPIAGLISKGFDSLPSAVQTVGSAIADKTPNLIKQTLASMGVGGGFGAATGALDNPENPLAGAERGGVGGALTVPAITGTLRLGGALGTGMSNTFWPAANAPGNAADRLAGIVGKEAKVGLPDLNALDQRIADSNSPLSLADVSLGVRNYVGTLFDGNTAAAPLIEKQLQDRHDAAAGRLTSMLDQTAITGPENWQADEILRQGQKSKAAPLYADAYMQPPLNPDHLEPGGALTTLMQRPSMKTAMGKALELAAEEGRDPNSLGITFDASGAPVFQGVPSWETLDTVKRGLDSVLSDPAKYPRNPFTGVRDFDDTGRAVVGTLSDFRTFLRTENPKYGAALDAFSGDQATRNALAEGGAALAPQRTASQNEAAFNLLAPGDQDFYRLGATNSLRGKILNSKDAADTTNQIANSQGMRDRLRVLFDSDDDYNKFLAANADEHTIFQTNQAIRGNSPTARRSGAMQAATPSSSFGAALPVALSTAFTTGSPMTGLKAGAAMLAGGVAKKIADRYVPLWAGRSPEAGTVAANLALEPGDRARSVIGLLGQQPTPGPSSLPAVGPIAGGLQTTLPYALTPSWLYR